MDPTTSSSPVESSSASTQHGEALQTVEALRAAIANHPSESLQALRANVDRMIAAESRLKASQLAVQSLTAKVSLLEAQISLRTASPCTPAQQTVPSQSDSNSFLLPVPSSSHRSAKLADSDKFSGKLAELPNLLAQLQLKLQANADHWPDEPSKIAYCISRLEGAALRNLRSSIRQEAVFGTNVPRIVMDFASTSALIERPQTSFGDPDPTGTARMEFAKFRQGKLDFSSYLSEFTRVMSVLNYDPAAKMDALEAGMSSRLREGLVYNIRATPTPANYDTWCNTLLQLDNRIRQLEAQKRGTYSTTPHVPGVISPSEPVSYPPNPDALDLSYSGLRQNALPVGRPAQHLRYETEAQGGRHVSPAEKAWRRASGCCDYCAGDHRQMACPVKVRGSNAGSRPTPGITTNNPFRIQAAELTPGGAGSATHLTVPGESHEPGFRSSLD